jgi:hypothetical protein
VGEGEPHGGGPRLTAISDLAPRDPRGAGGFLVSKPDQHEQGADPMSILTFAVLNAVLAAGLVSGLTAVMSLPLGAGRHDPAGPYGHPKPLPLAA